MGIGLSAQGVNMNRLPGKYYSYSTTTTVLCHQCSFKTMISTDHGSRKTSEIENG